MMRDGLLETNNCSPAQREEGGFGREAEEDDRSPAEAHANGAEQAGGEVPAARLTGWAGLGARSASSRANARGRRDRSE